MSASERGIGVAVMSSTSGASPFAPSALRCSTPKRCCSSTTASPSRANAVASWTSACVPTTSAGEGSASRAATSRRSFARRPPVTSSGAMPSGSSSRPIERACCSASSSVGAMIAAWKPFSIASRALNSATIVLPLPTSPWSNRCMRRSLHMSAKISRSTRVCAPVSVNGSASRNRVVSCRRFSNRIPRRVSRASALARCCRSCTNNSSSNASRARPSIASPSDVGRCTMRRASRMPGTAAARSRSGGRYSVTSASSSSRCASMIPRITLNDSPSVAGYTDSTIPSARVSSSSPRLTNSRGWSWRPWKKRTLPLTSSTSPLSIVRSRNGWPGHDTSIIPVSSLSTA